MMKKMVIGTFLTCVLAQPVFAMQERKDEGVHTAMRSPEEQEKLNSELRDAVRAGDLDSAEKLIKQGADVHTRNGDGKTALHLACIDPNIGLVKLLLACVDVNARDNFECTGLHFLCWKRGSQKALKIMTLLLADKNIQVNVADDNGETPLYQACYFDNPEAVKLLLESLVKPTLSWQQARLLWIGFMKERQEDCNLAKLSADMIDYIMSFCGNKKRNIEALKSLICRQDTKCQTAFFWAKQNTTIEKELMDILNPQAWHDDNRANKTYDALVTFLKEDKETRPQKNRLQQE